MEVRDINMVVSHYGSQLYEIRSFAHSNLDHVAIVAALWLVILLFTIFNQYYREVNGPWFYVNVR